MKKESLWVQTPKGRWELVKVSGKPRNKCQVKFCRNAAEVYKKYVSKTCSCCHRLQTARNNPAWFSWYNSRRNAKFRKVSFSLSFTDYKNLLASRPTPDHVLDRINPIKGYSLGNLQWLTPEENSRKGATFDKQAWLDEKIGNQQISNQNTYYYDDGPIEF